MFKVGEGRQQVADSSDVDVSATGHITLVVILYFYKKMNLIMDEITVFKLHICHKHT